MKTITLAATLLFAWQGVWAEGYEPHFKKIEGNNGVEQDGTKGHPFLINKEQDLIDLSEDVNNGCNNDKHFLLIKDLDFSKVTPEDNGNNFTPIGMGEELGDIDCPFLGFFNGQGHTISGINYCDEEGVGVGLFGYIYYPATISNIKLENCSFKGSYLVGAIVGNVGDQDIDSEWGIYECEVIGGTVEADQYAGGIIGYSNGMTINNCTCSAEVKGDEYVGGIAGLFKGNTGDNGFSVIEDCFFTGSVSGASNTGKIAGARGGVDPTTDTEGTIKLNLYEDDSEISLSNHDRLTYYNGIENVNVTLSGRELFKDGDWNTLCLPFDLTINGSVLNGATVKELVSSEYSKGSLTLNFTEDGSNLTAIEAGKPYIIKWTGGNNLTDPVFESVTIKGTTAGDKTTDWVDFVATYSPEAIYENSEDKTCLYLGADNTLYYPSSEDVKVNSFRAYFKLKNELTVGETPSEEPGNPETTSNSIKAFVLNFGDEETGIREISTPSNSSNSSNLWFTLDGRRLNGQPTQSGIFIHGSKKVILP